MDEHNNTKLQGNKLLLIVDPQIDFITGSLPVPGAECAMNALAEYIRTNIDDYAQIIVTADHHPMRHCSFISEGGEWPRHCVADTVGAAIWPPIMNELLLYPDKVTILHKGENTYSEEYSIFKNPDATEKILKILSENKIRIIDVCGLAGDVCVAETVSDGTKLIKESLINVLTDFSPSIGNKKILLSSDQGGVREGGDV